MPRLSRAATSASSPAGAAGWAGRAAQEPVRARRGPRRPVRARARLGSSATGSGSDGSSAAPPSARPGGGTASLNLANRPARWAAWGSAASTTRLGLDGHGLHGDGLRLGLHGDGLRLGLRLRRAQLARPLGRPDRLDGPTGSTGSARPPLLRDRQRHPGPPSRRLETHRAAGGGALPGDGSLGFELGDSDLAERAQMPGQRRGVAALRPQLGRRFDKRSAALVLSHDIGIRPATRDSSHRGEACSGPAQDGSQDRAARATRPSRKVSMPKWKRSSPSPLTRSSPRRTRLG